MRIEQQFNKIYHLKPDIFYIKLTNIDYIIKTKIKKEFLSIFFQKYKRKISTNEYYSNTSSEDAVIEYSSECLITIESEPDNVH
jgi:hypothetical protein